MSNLHVDLDELNKHDPKGFIPAVNNTFPVKDELGNSFYEERMSLPKAINFVDGTVAAPTTVDGDIYVLTGSGVVDSSWGGAAFGDWVRFLNTFATPITPLDGYLCFDETAAAWMRYDGSVWAVFGGGGGGGLVNGNIIYISPTGDNAALRADIVGDNSKPTTYTNAKVIAQVGDLFYYLYGTYVITETLLVDGTSGYSDFGAVFNADQSTTTKIFDNVGFTSGGEMFGYGSFNRISGGGVSVAAVLNLVIADKVFEAYEVTSTNTSAMITLSGNGRKLKVHNRILSTGGIAIDSFFASTHIDCPNIKSTAANTVVHNSNGGGNEIFITCQNLISDAALAYTGGKSIIISAEISGPANSVNYTGDENILIVPYIFGISLTGASTRVNAEGVGLAGSVNVNGGELIGGTYQGLFSVASGAKVIGARYIGKQGFQTDTITNNGGHLEMSLTNFPSTNCIVKHESGTSHFTCDGLQDAAKGTLSYCNDGEVHLYGKIKAPTISYVMQFKGTGKIFNHANIELTAVVGGAGDENDGFVGAGTATMIDNGTIINSADTAFLPYKVLSGTPILKVNSLNTNTVDNLTTRLATFASGYVNANGLNQGATVE
jgi:hypothetical protein